MLSNKHFDGAKLILKYAPIMKEDEINARDEVIDNVNEFTVIFRKSFVTSGASLYLEWKNATNFSHNP